MQLKNLLNQAIIILKEGEIINAALDAKVLLRYVSKIEPMLYPEAEIKQDVIKHYMQLIEKRIKREPVAKIIGSKDFWDNTFYVNKHVLDPRPDTEVILQEALKLLPDKNKPYQFLDLGTGTGCLLLSLLQEFQNAIGIASDISGDALDVAKINLDQLKLHSRASLIQQNWADALKNEFDLVVSNPPYIPSANIFNLEPEVKDYDPILALDGGKDGLDPYRYLAKQISCILKPNACAILEFGYDQGKEVREIFIHNGYNVRKMLFDLSGIERAIVVEV